MPNSFARLVTGLTPLCALLVCAAPLLVGGCSAKPKDDRPTFSHAVGPSDQLATLKNSKGFLGVEAATVFRVDDAVVRYKTGLMSSDRGVPLKLTPGRHRITAVLEVNGETSAWAEFPHDFEAGHVYRLTQVGLDKRMTIVDESVSDTMPDGSPRPKALFTLTRGKPPWHARRQYAEDSYTPQAPYSLPF